MADGRWPVEIQLTVDQFAALWRQTDALLQERWAEAPEASRLRSLQQLAVAGAAGHARAERAAAWELERVLVDLDAGDSEVVARRVATLAVVRSVLESGEDRARVDAAVDRSLAGLAGEQALGALAFCGRADRAEVLTRLGAHLEMATADAPRALLWHVEWALILRTGRAGPADSGLATACRLLGSCTDALRRAPDLGSPAPLLAGDEDWWAFDTAGCIASALGLPGLAPLGWTPTLRAALLGIGHVVYGDSQ